MAAQAAGISFRNPNYLDSQRITQNVPGVVGQLPSTIQELALQDLDPVSPTFGMFYFTPGYDPMGSGQPLFPP